MAVFRSRMFGEVAVGSDGAYVTRDMPVGARSLTRSLFVGLELDADQALLDRAASLVDTVAALDSRARAAIEADADEVPDYVSFHLEELDEGVLREIFGAARSAIDRATFLARLDLVGVGVHAREPDGFSLVLDYSIGRAHTDQVSRREARHGRASRRGVPGELRRITGSRRRGPR